MTCHTREMSELEKTVGSDTPVQHVTPARSISWPIVFIIVYHIFMVLLCREVYRLRRSVSKFITADTMRAVEHLVQEVPQDIEERVQTELTLVKETMASNLNAQIACIRREARDAARDAASCATNCDKEVTDCSKEGTDCGKDTNKELEDDVVITPGAREMIAHEKKKQDKALDDVLPTSGSKQISP